MKLIGQSGEKRQFDLKKKKCFSSFFSSWAHMLIIVEKNKQTNITCMNGEPPPRTPGLL